MELDLLTLPRAARRLGVSVRWLRAEADAGRVPCLRAGRRYLFSAMALAEALTARARSVELTNQHDRPS